MEDEIEGSSDALAYHSISNFNFVAKNLPKILFSSSNPCFKSLLSSTDVL